MNSDIIMSKLLSSTSYFSLVDMTSGFGQSIGLYEGYRGDEGVQEASSGT
jgi:hypothetical protein